MRRSATAQTIAASPTMVGAITTLIVILAVFLAYNANQGLPFVPTYRVSVEVPNAARLVDNNEVRIGGTRVGIVESIEPVVREDERGGEGAAAPELADEDELPPVAARLNLQLETVADPLPVDSIFRVRYRSAFGLKYLEITRGESEEMAPEGFTFIGTDDGDLLSLDEVERRDDDVERDDGIFLDQQEFDDIADTFDEPTRENIRLNLVGFGNALAGRGISLNEAVAALEPLFRSLGPVARILADPETGLERFITEIADAARIVAPVAQQQADLFTFAAIAFAALSQDPEALSDSIAEAPPTLETGIGSLARQRPFLRDLAELERRLQPGARDLRITLPGLNRAVASGTPALTRSVAATRRLEGALLELDRLVREPATGITLERLGDAFDEARPLSRHVNPAQTVCNYWNYWFTFLPEHLTERDSVGFTQRVSVILPPMGGLGLGNVVLPGEQLAPIGGYSGIQSDGRRGFFDPSPGLFDPREMPILHGSPYQVTGQERDDCQAGQTGYLLGDLRLPRQGVDNPAIGVPNFPGTRGRTTLFFNESFERELRDTVVERRTP